MRHDCVINLKEYSMFKEVVTSGQISPGKKYVGVLFDGAVHLNGGIVMNPRRVVPANSPHPRQWAEENAASIDQYNAWASQREPYSQRVRRWRENAAPQNETGTL